MENNYQYASNSHKSKEEQQPEVVEEKRLEKVISGEAKLKKPGFFARCTNAFIAEDAKTIKEFLLTDVVVPAVKKAVSDLVTNGIDMLLYGSAGNPSKKQSVASKVSYKSYYAGKNQQPSVSYRNQTREFDNVIVDSRGEAEEILDRLQELIDTYGLVSVMDFYDICGITTTQYTDSNYGWTNVNSAQIIRTREGFMIKMPRVLPLDR